MAKSRYDRLNPVLRSILELGPLVVFFLAFRFGETLLATEPLRAIVVALTDRAAADGESGALYLATVLFMLAIAVSLGVSWSLTRHVPKMAVVTAAVVAIFGGLTLWLRDETFIKMKPTIVNGTFAAILAVGLLQGKSYLKALMGEVLPLDDTGWMKFTRRWVLFFTFMALLNELVWRSQSTEFWVSFKTFSGVPLTVLFVASQVPMLQRHMQHEKG